MPESQPLPPAGPICNADADCILVDSGGCCGCSAGGSEIAIHRSQEDSHYERIAEQECPEPTYCPQVYNCGRYQARCQNSQCVAVDIVSSPNPQPNPNPTCNTDADCVLVNSGCYGCDYGEGHFAIHISQRADHIRDIREEPCGPCTMEVRDCTHYQAQCHNSQCVTRYDSEGVDPVLVPNLSSPGQR